MEAEVNGVRLHYELAGNGEKRIVLLHGWGCDGSLMAPGGQGAYRGRLGIDRGLPCPWEKRAASATLGRTGVCGMPAGAAAPAGLSALRRGGPFLWRTGDHPAGGGASGDVYPPCANGAAGIRPKPTEAARKRSETYRKLKGLCEGAKKWKIFGTLPERAEESLRKKFGSRDYNALDAEMRQTFVKVISQDLTPYLPRIQQPTLLLWGTEDTETPLWMGQEMERSIPDAALIPRREAATSLMRSSRPGSMPLFASF